jgi:hypothetical protein
VVAGGIVAAVRGAEPFTAEATAGMFVGMTMVRPSSSSRIAYPTGRVSSTTTRATPLRYWLPRICLSGPAETASGVLRQPYVVSSKSTTRRAGVSMSSA